MLARQSASKWLDKGRRLQGHTPSVTSRVRKTPRQQARSQGASYLAYPGSPASPPGLAASEAMRATVRPPPRSNPCPSGQRGAAQRAKPERAWLDRSCPCAGACGQRVASLRSPRSRPRHKARGRTRLRGTCRATAAAMRIVCQAAYARCTSRGTSAALRRDPLGGGEAPPPVVSGAIERAANAARRARRGARCRPPRPPAAERPPAPDAPARTQRRAGTPAAEGGRSASLGGHAASRSAAAQWSRRGAPRGRVRAARRPPEAARRRAAALRGGRRVRSRRTRAPPPSKQGQGSALDPPGAAAPGPPARRAPPCTRQGASPLDPRRGARKSAPREEVRLAAQAGGGPEKRKITPGTANTTAGPRQR